MKTTTSTTTTKTILYSNTFYAEIVDLANHFWQQTGCEFGKYPECLLRATSELTVSNQPALQDTQTGNQSGAHNGAPNGARPYRRKRAGHASRT